MRLPHAVWDARRAGTCQEPLPAGCPRVPAPTPRSGPSVTGPGPGTRPRGWRWRHGPAPPAAPVAAARGRAATRAVTGRRRMAAAPYGAGQYEDAFSPHRLQNWSVPRTGRQRPSLRVGSTLIIADDRGHLLPTVPRSQASPWGTFVGTWDMPPRIPPARLDLSSRSAAAAARLVAWIHQPSALTHACNGLRTEVTGKPPEPQLDMQTAKEPSWRSSGVSSHSFPPFGAPLEEPPSPGAATAPLPSEPGCQGVQLKADTAPGSPAAHQPCSQPAMLQRQTPRSPLPAAAAELPASIHPAAREATPQQGSAATHTNRKHLPTLRVRLGNVSQEPQGG
ncbi:protein Flattop [Colius striatus]|uniref:protein Flattop n=1 Tax=Colius striatus TaxID=57412 RepID=UPI002B1D7239|nr:protein Flattop [Colius striatus]